jgi:hypothetical protein
VNFAPSAPQAYSDAIVFRSDAARVDSVSLLQGGGGARRNFRTGL